MTVVLDLDETLVHSYIVDRASDAARHAIYVKNEENGGHYVNVRPGVAELLRVVGSLCEGVLWTAGTREYAARVIEIVDYAAILQHKIYRNDSWYCEDGAKRLARLGRDLPQTLIVDNSMSAIAANPENAILVEDYIEDEDDDTLYTLAHLIQEMVISGFSVSDYLASCPLLHRKPIPSNYRRHGGPSFFYFLKARF